MREWIAQRTTTKERYKFEVIIKTADLNLNYEFDQRQPLTCASYTIHIMSHVNEALHEWAYDLWRKWSTGYRNIHSVNINRFVDSAVAPTIQILPIGMGYAFESLLV